MNASRHTAALAAALLVLGTSTFAQGDGAWAADASGEFARALKSVARRATAAVSAPADVAGVRETVSKLTVSVARTCGAEGPRYALQPVSADLGPALSASGESLSSEYLYPQESGLQLALAGDAPGAALSVRSQGEEARALGTILGPEPGQSCSPYPMSSVEVRLAPGVAASISVAPRTGIFSPACYKDIINGFYKLDTWTILTLAFPQETLTVKTKDGMSFPDQPQCRAFYARLPR